MNQTPLDMLPRSRVNVKHCVNQLHRPIRAGLPNFPCLHFAHADQGTMALNAFTKKRPPFLGVFLGDRLHQLGRDQFVHFNINECTTLPSTLRQLAYYVLNVYHRRFNVLHTFRNVIASLNVFVQGFQHRLS